MGSVLTYSRAIFDVADEAAAKRIILTPEFGLDTEERWKRETPYIGDLIAEDLAPQPGQLFIDYGCGIGRLSKLMIERFGCRVLGVDISERMRSLAPDYVASQAFSVVSPHMLQSLCEKGLRADGALSVWVLQHCIAPARDIALVHDALSPGARFFVLNLKGRAVPTLEGKWANDGIDVAALLAERFTLHSQGDLDLGIVPAGQLSFRATYARP